MMQDLAMSSKRLTVKLHGVDPNMFGGGFVGISSEWWHFELPNAARYPLLKDRFDCFPLTHTSL